MVRVVKRKHFVPAYVRKSKHGRTVRVHGFFRKTRKLGKTVGPVGTISIYKSGGSFKRYRPIKDKNGLFTGVRPFKGKTS